MQDSTKQFVSFSGVETEIKNFEPVSSFWQHETAHLLGFSAPLKNIWEGVQPSKLPNRRPRLLLDVGQDGNCLGNNEQNMFDSPKSVLSVKGLIKSWICMEVRVQRSYKCTEVSDMYSLSNVKKS